MSSVNLFRGGTPIFRPSFCCGDFPAWQMPVDAEHRPGTPPYDSHADGARGQGWLNLSFPFCPNLLETTTHRWMHHALKKLSATDDIIRLIWIPNRGYVESLHMEITRFDTLLDGVKVTPVVERATWDFDNEEWTYTTNDKFTQELASFSNNQTIALGTPAEEETDDDGQVTTAGDIPYIFARFPQTAGDLPWSFSHNIVKYDENNKPTGGIDAAYGANVFGLKIAEGDASAIADIWRANFELWICLKFIGFECHGFTG